MPLRVASARTLILRSGSHKKEIGIIGIIGIIGLAAYVIR
jgi:hypothetical protein